MTTDEDDSREYDDTDFGIELDKLEVPDAASIPVAKKTDKTPTYEKTEETEPEIEVDVEIESQKGLRFKVIIAAATIPVLAALFFLLNQDFRDAP